MYNCPNCGELIGEDADTCFKCKHIMTAEEIKARNRTLESEHCDSDEAAREEFTRKYRLVNGIGCVAMIAAILIYINLAEADKAAAGLVILIGTAVAYIVVTFIAGVNRCPSCGYLLGRRGMIDEYCPHCGAHYKNSLFK